MIAAEAPVLFSKACEMFILELTLRSWIHTEENKRRTLQRNDIAGAITRGDIFDFLVDIVPRDELKVWLSLLKSNFTYQNFPKRAFYVLWTSVLLLISCCSNRMDLSVRMF
jgi:nuclear transcription factor Y gamma